MAAETIHDLLPIPAGIEKPHPYQVLGLEPGEQDPAKIKAAIHSRIAALKAVRDETDTALWNRAARLVNQSRVILADPQKKSELDARFGILAAAAASETAPADAARAGSTPAETPAATAPADPLAAWLPAGDPLTAWVPEPTRHLDRAGGAAAAGAALPSPEAFPLVVESSPGAPVSRRGRRSSSRLALPAVTAALVLLVAGLAYFLFWGPGGIEIRSGQGQLTLSTKSKGRGESDAETGVRPGGGQAERPAAVASGTESSTPSDPVLGGLVPEGDRRPSGGNSLAADLQASGIAFDAGEDPAPSRRPSDDAPAAQDATASAEPLENKPSEIGEAAAPEGAAPDASEPPLEQPMQPAAEAESPAEDELRGEDNAVDSPSSEATMPPGAASSPEQIARLTAEADAAIERASQQIRGAQWQQMKSAAERATELAMTETQKERAESLYQLVDLATYYRGGLQRSVEQLEAGDQIELPPAIAVIVVEASDAALAIRRNARNHRYSLDELPLVVVDAVAPYSMDADEPTTRAAKAAYQAIAPQATEAHRQQATESLRAISGEVEGADPERVAAAIEKVFGQRNEQSK